MWGPYIDGCIGCCTSLYWMVFHCYNKIPGLNQLSRERVSFGLQSLRRYGPSWWGRHSRRSMRPAWQSGSCRPHFISTHVRSLTNSCKEITAMVLNPLVKPGPHVRHHGCLPTTPSFLSAILFALQDLRIHPCEAATMTVLLRAKEESQWAEEMGQRMNKFWIASLFVERRSKESVIGVGKVRHT